MRGENPRGGQSADYALKAKQQRPEITLIQCGRSPEMEGVLNLPVSKDLLRRAAELARQCSTGAARERVLVAQAAALTVREYLSESAGLKTGDGRYCSTKYVDLLDVCDFRVGNWYVEVRAVTVVDRIALFVPAMPLMVGLLSDFYVCARMDESLGSIDIFGYAARADLAKADLSANRLFAILPLERLRPSKLLAAALKEERAVDSGQSGMFEEWQIRIDRVVTGLRERLSTEGVLRPKDLERLTAGLRDDMSRIYGEQYGKTDLEPLYRQLFKHFGIDSPVPAAPDSPVAFINSAEELEELADPSVQSDFFLDELSVRQRVSFYRHLIESDTALEEHRRVRRVLDAATAGRHQSSPRRRLAVRKARGTVVPQLQTPPVTSAAVNEVRGDIITMDELNLAVDTLERMTRSGLPLDAACQRLSALMKPELLNAARKEIEKKSRVVWTLTEPRGLVGKGLEDWYTGPQEEYDRFWPALREFLRESENWPLDAVNSIDQASTRVLSRMQHPGVGAFQTRGLVLGYVQSGKTANFTAVISKAADVGYKFFIVLSGVTSKLRDQTQRRLDRDIRDRRPTDWINLTEVGRDFRETGNVNSLLAEKHQHKILCVVKKVPSRLARLKKWLEGASKEIIRNCPVLVIDDEADNASVNTSTADDRRSRINGYILELLQLIPRAAYIGYTATPFANFFVDPSVPEDLYPKDFIIDLPKPTGYFGPESLFGRERLNLDEPDADTDGYDMIRRVPGEETASLQPTSQNDRDTFVPTVTPSLEEAICYFLMATAARACRGDEGRSSTMLIHTTSYTAIHGRFVPPVNDFVTKLLDGLRSGDAALISRLQSQWEEESGRVPPEETGPIPVPFSDVLSRLEEVIQKTDVKVENFRSIDRLDYETPGTYIVIGGNILSRGITLDGLVVSFFIRTASAYDTLLQMGRWFGYRSGYADLPRIWMTDELRQYFFDLATVEQEIRYDIRRYESLEFTPLDFGVKVRTHPQMNITSKLKMQKAVFAEVSYEGKRLQTILFNHRNRKWLLDNQTAARNLIRRIIEEDGKTAGRRVSGVFLFENVSSALILKFLREYRFYEDGRLNPGLISGYILDQNALGDLSRWNVAVMTKKDDEMGRIDLGLTDEVNLINRSRMKLLGGMTGNYANIKALMSKADLVADRNLPSKDVASLGTKTLINLREAGDPGLLLLYPIAKDSAPRGDIRSGVREPLDAVEHVIGVGLVFPGAREQTLQNYMTVDLSDVRREIPEDDPEEDEEA